MRGNSEQFCSAPNNQTGVGLDVYCRFPSMMITISPLMSVLL